MATTKSGVPKRELLFVSEVSEMTGIPVPTLKMWRLSDRGPRSFRLSESRGRVVYRLADVNAWIDAQEQASGAGGVA